MSVKSSPSRAPTSTRAASGGVGGEGVKYRVVRDALEEVIRQGEFVPGGRLPADRDLALRFGVSYMTARRAVTDLVEADLLERRIGDGTYVRSHTQARLSQTTLHLICSAYGGSLQSAFLNLGGKAAEARGWKAHIIRLDSEHERAAVRALESGAPALILSDDPELEGPLGRALAKSRRAILIGNRLEGRSVPCVLADDARAVRLAVEHLRGHGHQSIAMLANYPDSHNERVQIAAWREAVAQSGEGESEQGGGGCKYLDGQLVACRTPRFECPTRHAYDAARAWLRAEGRYASALICLGDELALGALAACRDEGRDVPTSMSLLNLSDSALMAFAHPPVTCVDVDLEAHITRALEILDESLSGALREPERCCTLIEPRLIERRSVAPRTRPKQ